MHRMKSVKLLQKTSVIMRQYLEDIVKKLNVPGISVAYTRIIMMIGMSPNGNIMQNEVRGRIGVRRSTISSNLSLLEDKNIIWREKGQNNRDNVIFLTDYGIEIFNSLAILLRESNMRTLEGIGDEQLKIFNSVLEKIIFNIGSNIKNN